MTTTEPLITRYRPTQLDDVIGQDTVVRALRNTIKQKDAKSFLFCGPAGTGKTTLARIVASMFKVDPKDGLIEVDAATNTGVDDMRGVQDVLQYRAFGQSGQRAIIIDECHMLSRNAWNSLLKSVEQPPSHVTWLFCTTEPGKVPKTIRTRCTSFTLRNVDNETLDTFLLEICDAEKIKLANGVRSLIVREAQGSPRQLLVNIGLCRAAKDRHEAAQLIHAAADADTIKELCQLLNRGGTWMKAMGLVQRLREKNENPESVRIVVMNYFGAAALTADTRNARAFLAILDAFSQSYNPSEGYAPLLLSIGRLLME